MTKKELESKVADLEHRLLILEKAYLTSLATVPLPGNRTEDLFHKRPKKLGDWETENSRLMEEYIRQIKNNSKPLKFSPGGIRANTNVYQTTDELDDAGEINKALDEIYKSKINPPNVISSSGDIF